MLLTSGRQPVYRGVRRWWCVHHNGGNSTPLACLDQVSVWSRPPGHPVLHGRDSPEREREYTNYMTHSWNQSNSIKFQLPYHINTLSNLIPYLGAAGGPSFPAERTLTSILWPFFLPRLMVPVRVTYESSPSGISSLNTTWPPPLLTPSSLAPSPFSPDPLPNVDGLIEAWLSLDSLSMLDFVPPVVKVNLWVSNLTLTIHTFPC